MGSFAYVVVVLALTTVAVHSQTVTTINPAGQTVVEVITVDPDLGLPTTETLQTLTTTSTTPTTTTTQQGNQGPVGQPQTAAAGQTVYTYTTTNANGETEGVVATFTPSFGPTATGGSVTAAPGTILNYSSWRGSVGSNTVAVISAGTARWSVQPRWANIGVALCASLTGGAWLALA